MNRRQHRWASHQGDPGGVELEDADRASCIMQQVEITDVPVRIEEHRGRAYWCPSCREFHYVPLPPEVEKGQLFGPRLTTLVEKLLFRFRYDTPSMNA